MAIRHISLSSSNNNFNVLSWIWAFATPFDRRGPKHNLHKRLHTMTFLAQFWCHFFHSIFHRSFSFCIITSEAWTTTPSSCFLSLTTSNRLVRSDTSRLKEVTDRGFVITYNICVTPSDEIEALPPSFLFFPFYPLL
jgi:hypothetical protein